MFPSYVFKEVPWIDCDGQELNQSSVSINRHRYPFRCSVAKGRPASSQWRFKDPHFTICFLIGRLPYYPWWWIIRSTRWPVDRLVEMDEVNERISVSPGTLKLHRHIAVRLSFFSAFLSSLGERKSGASRRWSLGRRGRMSTWSYLNSSDHAVELSDPCGGVAERRLEPKRPAQSMEGCLICYEWNKRSCTLPRLNALVPLVSIYATTDAVVVGGAQNGSPP